LSRYIPFFVRSESLLIHYINKTLLAAADKKRQLGVWLEEKHYRKAPDDTIFYNWRQIEKWCAGEI
jgi:hypothetical protein